MINNLQATVDQVLRSFQQRNMVSTTLACIALAYVTSTTHHVFRYLPPYSEAPYQGAHGLAQPIHNAQANAVEQHGMAIFGGGSQRHGRQHYPNQTQHQPRFGQRGTTDRNDAWSIRAIHKQPHGVTDDNHLSLLDSQLRHESPATRMWQALLPQARDILFSHAPGATNDTHYISGKTGSWFTYTF